MMGDSELTIEKCFNEYVVKYEYHCRGDSSVNFIQHSSDDDEDHADLYSPCSSTSVSRKTSDSESVMSSTDSEMADLVNKEPGSRKSSDTNQPQPSSSSTTEPGTEGNNNSLPKEISYAELELLKKLEEQNR